MYIYMYGERESVYLYIKSIVKVSVWEREGEVQ